VIPPTHWGNPTPWKTPKSAGFRSLADTSADTATHGQALDQWPLSLLILVTAGHHETVLAAGKAIGPRREAVHELF
jgi:hypothetical protein